MRRERSFGSKSHLYIGEGISSKKFEKRHPASKLKWYALGALFAVVAAVVGLRTCGRISVVRVEGVAVERPQDVRDAVRGVLSGSYFGVVPRSSVLVYPREQILASLASAFPRFSSVAIQREGSNALVVKVVERDSAYVSCYGDESCYYVDQDGVVFAPAPLFSGNLFFEFHQDTVSTTTPLGSRVMPPAEWANVLLLRERLDALFSESAFATSTTVREYVFTDGVREIEILNDGQAEKSWRIRYDVDQDVDQMIGTMREVIAYVTDELSKGKKDRSLEYVDIRFGNKVVYKYKE